MSEMISLGVQLKKPCADCPFLESTPKHSGVLESLSEYYTSVENKRFIHTCHKTDSRADSEEGKKYRGQTQHCAGALALMKNDTECMSDWVSVRIALKHLDMRKIKTKGVFTSFKAMVLAYYDWHRAGMPNDLAKK